LIKNGANQIYFNNFPSDDDAPRDSCGIVNPTSGYV